MIEVVAPAGHDVGESSTTAASFDEMDLDSLLDNRPVPSPSPAPTRKLPVAAPPTSAPPTRPQAELQPGEDWTNPATKKKQKAILIIMAAIGSLLILAAIGFFFLLPSKPEGDVAGGTPDVENKTPPTDSESKPLETEAPAAQPTEVETNVPEVGETESPEVPDPADSTDPSDIAEIPGVPELPPSIAGLEAETAPASGTKDLDVAEPKKPLDAEPKDQPVTLRSILAESGTSMLKLQNAASLVRDDFGIGAQKYFFEKLQLEPIDYNRRKDQKLLGVAYDQQSLQTVLHELASISGLQLTIDAPLIALSQNELNPKVAFQIENDSTASVIRKVAQSVGLVAVETDEGFRVTVPQNDKPVQESISVTLLVENEQDGAELAKQVQRLVWPGTWQAKGDADPNKGSCQFSNSQLEIQHTQVAIDEVKRLIDGLKAVARDDTEGSELLQPVPWIDQGDFSKPFKAKNSVRGSVGEFFRSLSKDYQIQVMADWQALAETGWTSDAKAASWIEEKTVGDVVRETAHAFGSGIYVIDQRTVWLTPTKVASEIFELKLYPIAGITNGKLSPEGISNLLAETLGDQAFRSGVSFAYFPNQNAMALRAPQTLHRQVEAIFAELQQ